MMSAPVAGRRKGVSAAPAPAPSGPAAADSGPSWLMGDGPAVAAAPAPAAAVAYSAPPPAAASSDPLSFLDFDEPAAPAPPPPPQHAAPPQPMMTSAIPSFLMDDPVPAAPAAPQYAAPVAAAAPAPTYGTVPSFLDDTPAAPSAPIMAQMQHPAVNPYADSYRSLMTELHSLDSAIETCQQTITSLTNGDHEMQHELKSLQIEFDALKSKEAEAIALKQRASEGADAEAAEVHSKLKESDDAELEKFRLEQAEAYTARLNQARANLSKQEELLAEANSAVSEMKSKLSEPPHISATRDLEIRMSTFLRNMRSDFSLQVRPLLSNSIRENMSTASQQRQDIFHTDRNKRLELLREFRQNRSKAFAAYQEENRARMEEKRDVAFGKLLRDYQAEREKRAIASRERLNSSRAAAELSMTTARQTMEQSLRHAIDNSKGNVDGQVAIYKAEEGRLRERRSADLQTFKERAEAEIRSLLSGHRVAVSSRTEAKEDMASLFDTFRDSVSMLQTQLAQLRIAAQTDTRMLKMEGSRAAPTSREQDVKAAERHVKDFHDSLTKSVSELSVFLARMRSTSSSTEDIVKAFSKTLHEKRVKLNVLHEQVDGARRAWDGDIRRQLSVLGTDTETDIPHAKDLAREVITRTRERAEAVGRKQLYLRQIRHVFSEQVSQHTRRFSSHLKSADAALGKVFDVYEKLRQTSAHVASRRSHVEYLEETLRTSRVELDRDRTYLVERQRHVERAAAQLHDESLVMRRVEKQLRKSMNVTTAMGTTISHHDLPYQSMRSNGSCATSTTSSRRSSVVAGNKQHQHHQQIPPHHHGLHQHQQQKTVSQWPMPSPADRASPAPKTPTPTESTPGDQQSPAAGANSQRLQSNDTDFSQSLIPFESEILEGTPDPLPAAISGHDFASGSLEVPQTVDTTVLGRSLTTPSTMS